MAETAVVDTSFLVALLGEDDQYHAWAESQAGRFVTPWRTCESVLSESFHLLGAAGWPGVAELLRRESIVLAFNFVHERDRVLALMSKYRDLPMAFADACLVRMTELFPRAVVLTTDEHFRVYRRHGREVVPHVLPA